MEAGRIQTLETQAQQEALELRMRAMEQRLEAKIQSLSKRATLLEQENAGLRQDMDAVTAGLTTMEKEVRQQFVDILGAIKDAAKSRPPR